MTIGLIISANRPSASSPAAAPRQRVAFKRITRRAPYRFPRPPSHRARALRSERVPKPTKKKPPPPAVVAPQLEVVLLEGHSSHNVADYRLCKHAELRLRAEGNETERGEKDFSAAIDHSQV